MVVLRARRAQNAAKRGSFRESAATYATPKPPPLDCPRNIRRGVNFHGDLLIGGEIAGGVCGLIGIAVSFAFGDVPLALLAFGTAASAVTGAIGGGLARAVTRA